MISGNHRLWLVAIKRGTVYTASEVREVWDQSNAALREARSLCTCWTYQPSSMEGISWCIEGVSSIRDRVSSQPRQQSSEK